ncbi:uncharacterized protein LOC113214032 isoform X2 [Frankliniella occidentalis]|nr:uncharacterized protein LOC113214032 isoform X2 [Frankliniella occidentalis]
MLPSPWPLAPTSPAPTPLGFQGMTVFRPPSFQGFLGFPPPGSQGPPPGGYNVFQGLQGLQVPALGLQGLQGTRGFQGFQGFQFASTGDVSWARFAVDLDRWFEDTFEAERVFVRQADEAVKRHWETTVAQEKLASLWELMRCAQMLQCDADKHLDFVGCVLSEVEHYLSFLEVAEQVEVPVLSSNEKFDLYCMVLRMSRCLLTAREQVVDLAALVNSATKTQMEQLVNVLDSQAHAQTRILSLEAKLQNSIDVVNDLLRQVKKHTNDMCWPIAYCC